jgi:hypothetical protein
MRRVLHSDPIAEAAVGGQPDVGLEQRSADLLERINEVGSADSPIADAAGREPIEPVGQGVEHGVSG